MNVNHVGQGSRQWTLTGAISHHHHQPNPKDSQPAAVTTHNYSGLGPQGAQDEISPLIPGNY